MDIVGTLAQVGISTGTASSVKYFFDRPGFNRAGIQSLVIGTGLPAAGIQVVSRIIGYIAGKAVEKENKQTVKDVTYCLSVAIITYFAKGYIGWSNKEALAITVVTSAVSSYFRGEGQSQGRRRV